MDFISAIGSLAAFFTTIAFVPQAIQIIRTKNTQSISLAMYSFFTIGIALWLIYGILMQDFPIIMANSVTVVLSVIILTMKIRYK